MKNNEFKLYIDELKNLCAFFKIAINGVNDCLKNTPNNNPASNDAFWYSAQNSITYAANISKILWGSNAKDNEERTDLRKLLKVDDEFYIKNKQLRNKLEHIDENLKKFSKYDVSVLWNRNIIGDSPMLIFIDGKPFKPENEKTLRSYNYDTTNFIFMGNTFNLQASLKEIEQIALNVNIIENKINSEGETYETLVREAKQD